GIGRLARVKGDFMQIALFVDRENGQRESVVFKGGFQKLIGLAGKRARALEIKSRLGHRAESGRWKDSALSYQPAQFCDSRIGVFLMRDGAEETAVAVKQDDRGGVIHRVVAVLQFDLAREDIEVLDHFRYLLRIARYPRD